LEILLQFYALAFAVQKGNSYQKMLNLQIALGAIILLTLLLHYENSQNIKGLLSAKTLLSSLFILAILVQPHAITYYYQFLLAGMIQIPSICKKNSPKTKTRPWLKIILCLLWLPVMLPFGCASGITGNSDEIDFNTITVLSDWTKSGTVRLTDGEYRKSTAPDSSTNIVVKLTDKKVEARINGKDTAAVILATDPGGSGTFFDLALLVKGTKHHRRPTHRSCLEMAADTLQQRYRSRSVKTGTFYPATATERPCPYSGRLQ
jgi:hypothetical protein